MGAAWRRPCAAIVARVTSQVTSLVTSLMTAPVVAKLVATLVHTAVAVSTLSASPSVVRADPPPPPPGVSAALDSLRALRGASLTVTLITYGPSDVFYERFGHAALAVRDSLTGEDVAYNWGIFDFDQPNFLGRFLTGDTEYSMAGYPTALFNAIYVADNRSVRQQVLALSAVERAALFEYLQWNALEANKYYRYDYYQQNCSTMLRDALDRVLGGRLKPGLDVPGDGRTWRGETARVLASMLPYYAGIQIALGRRADVPLSKWDEEFMPEHMADHFASLVMNDATGRRMRLVRNDTVVFASTRRPLPSEPPSRLAMAALLGLTLAGLMAGLADASATAARAVFSALVAVWYLVGGALGTALLLAATVTKHAPYMGANTTLFALQPLLLLAALVVPFAFLRGVRTRTAAGVSTIIAVLSLCAVVLQLVPSWSQESGVVLAVVVPVHVAISLAVWRLGHTERLRARARV